MLKKQKNTRIKEIDYAFNEIAPDLLQIYGSVNGHALQTEHYNQKCWRFDIKFFKHKTLYKVSNPSDCTIHNLGQLKIRIAKTIKQAGNCQKETS